MSQLTPADKVAAYIKLRDYKKAAEDEFKKSMERVYRGMEKLECELLHDLSTLGADSLACEAGTVYRNTKSSASVKDRNAFLEFVRAHELWEALDVKANGPFVRDFINEHKEVIPGVHLNVVDTVGIRRS